MTTEAEKLLRTSKHVQDEVIPQPRYMIVGEAPGREEEAQGRPFVGRSGHHLDNLLIHAGISRSECYITNVSPVRPPKNDFSIFLKDSNILAKLSESLHDKIIKYRPKVVITLGEHAMRALLGLEGITDRRGSIFYFRDTIPVVPTFHPAYALRGGGTSFWLTPTIVFDLSKAKDVSSGLRPSYPQYQVIHHPDELISFFKEFTSFIALDIEVSMDGGGWIKSIGLSGSDNFGIVIPFPQNQAGPSHFREYISILSQFFRKPHFVLVTHNGYNFDLPHLEKSFGLRFNGLLHDTLILHHMLYPEFPHSLKYMASIYTTIPYWKDLMETDLYRYNAYDAVATFICSRKMLDEADARGMRELYQNYYWKLWKPLNVMTTRGIRIDRDYQASLKESLKKEASTIQSELNQVLSNDSRIERLKRRLKALERTTRKTLLIWTKGKARKVRRKVSTLKKTTQAQLEKASSLNVRSSRDLSSYLYRTLRLPRKFSKSGTLTTNETAINALYLKTGNPILKKILTLRKTLNALSRWGELKSDSQGRITTTYSFAETGRLRSGKMEAK